MNQNLGLIGTKLGCTQLFDADGNRLSVTVIEAGPCVVVGKRTPDRDGYSALVLGHGTKPERLVSRPVAGAFAKAGVEATRRVRELRLPPDVVAKFEVGQAIRAADVFEAGQKVDVAGLSRGRGNTGVMRRWNFKGAKNATHGTHEYQRHGGSIGQNMTPGRTWPNKGMPGQYGNERVTVQNLRVARVLPEQNVVLVEGAVPGPRSAVLIVRGAVKAKKRAAAATA